MFLNFSNHSSDKWSAEQLSASEMYGKVQDFAFPVIDPHMKKEEIDDLADTYVNDILKMNPSCVMCQGEFCFSYAVIKKLKANNIRVVAACSERVVEEQITDKETKKVSIFKFVQFREY